MVTHLQQCGNIMAMTGLHTPLHGSSFCDGTICHLRNLESTQLWKGRISAQAACRL